MKKIFSFLVLISFWLSPFSCATANQKSYEGLPELPVLPSLDIYKDGPIDAFSPSSAPPQIAPKQPVVSQPQAKPTVPSTPAAPSKPVKPVQKPQHLKPQAKPVKQTPVNNQKNSYYKNNQKTSYVMPKGKKFKVRLQQSISDRTPEGARVTFVSVYPETSRYVTVPSGTIFRGKVSDTHQPYLTGNGGLIVINVDQMLYNGKAYEVDAKVSVANGKRIFLNNIKGKRMYFQSIPKAMNPGAKFFKKMWRVTCSLAKNESGVEIILTPFSLITGSLVYAVNFVASPVLAIFYKGKSIHIPSNSQFTIQLREDVYLLK